jgi:hypothetical protein
MVSQGSLPAGNPGTYGYASFSDWNGQAANARYYFRYAVASGSPFTSTVNTIYVRVNYTVPSLTVTSPNGGESWQPGTTHNITWTSSNVTGPIQIQPYLNGVPQANINPSAPNTGSYSWSIPSDYPPGSTYKVGLSAMSGTVSDFSDGDFSITALPDFVILSVTGPSAAAAGDTVSVTVSARNQGPDPIQSGSYVVLRMIMSPDQVINLADSYYVDYEVPIANWASGAAVSHTFSYTIPSGASGTYYWGAYVDAAAYWNETDENNNALSGNSAQIGQNVDFAFLSVNGAITITEYTGPGGDVTIPSTINELPVTSIGDRAFYNKSSLSSVTIPNSVTNIGAYAFSSCVNLTSVTIPDSVTSIKAYAFSACIRLTGVTIPTSVTSIGEMAFGFCRLSAITVDGLNSFYSSLDGVLFNKSQTTLIQCPGGKAGGYAIPNSVTSIGDWAFSDCPSLTSVTIPNSVTSIGNYAFYGCYSLTSVVIPNGVTSIGNSAFISCTGLTSVTIPNSVTSIGAWAFQSCHSLTSVTIGNSVTSIGDGAFLWCGSLTSVTIPNSVTSIGSSAFYDCTSLTSVTIPNSVVSIGENAFSWCTSLTAITVDALNSVYSSLAGVLFNESQTTLIQCPGGKAGSYTIPNSVTSIGNQAFAGCASLTSVTIPNSVTSIGDWAFEVCSSLTSVTIPSSVTTIGSYAFSYCPSLTGAYFQGNAPSLGSSVFDGDNNATVYYLARTTGWGPTFGACPTALWIQALPDFVVLSVTGPSAAAAGDTVSVTVSARNQGPDPIQSGSYVVLRMIMSPDQVINLADTYYVDYQVPIADWANGATVQHTFSYTIPSGALGTYYWGAYVDAGTYWNEADENNNALSGNSVQVQAPPALTVTSPNGGESWQVGTTHNITWTSSDVTGTIQIQPYLNGVPQSNINPSAPNTGSYSWSIPSDYPPGSTYKIGLSAMSGTVSDLSDGNFSITALPDFVILSVSGPSAAATGDTVSVTVSARNQGPDPIQSGSYVVLRMIMSPYLVINLADTYYVDYQVPIANWASGATVSNTFSYTIPSGASGTYYWGAYVDAGTYWNESDENNKLPFTALKRRGRKN